MAGVLGEGSRPLVLELISSTTAMLRTTACDAPTDPAKLLPRVAAV